MQILYDFNMSFYFTVWVRRDMGKQYTIKLLTFSKMAALRSYMPPLPETEAKLTNVYQYSYCINQPFQSPICFGIGRYLLSAKPIGISTMLNLQIQFSSKPGSMKSHSNLNHLALQTANLIFLSLLHSRPIENKPKCDIACIFYMLQEST